MGREPEPEAVEPGGGRKQGTFAQFRPAYYELGLTDAIKDDAAARPFTPDAA